MKSLRGVKTKTTSLRIDSDLDGPVKDWLKQNPGYNLSRLINLAVRKYITQKQELKPVKVLAASNDQADQSIDQMMQQHQDMLDKLK